MEGGTEGRPLLHGDGSDDGGPADHATDVGGSAGGGGGSSGDGEVARLRAELAAQQELLSAVLAGQRASDAAPSSVASGGSAPRSSSTGGSATVVDVGAPGAEAPAAAAAVAADTTAGLSDAELAARLQQAESLGGGGEAGAAAVDADAQYASLLQSMEMQLATRETEEESKQSAFEDPVWGKFEPPEGGARPHHVICFSMCPCCIGPYCSAERKGVLKRISRSVSFVFAVIQTILLLSSFAMRGVAPSALNPMIGPWPDTLDDYGAKNAAHIVYQGEVWRFFSPMFLHAGIIHLLMNMLMQLRMGLYLEFEWGKYQYTLLYIATGMFSALASTVFIPDTIGVGASGALMGILGAWIVDILTKWGDGDAQAQGQRSFQLVIVFINALIILGFSMVPYIDWAAHAGGLFGGVLFSMIMWSGRLHSPRRARLVRWGAVAVLSIFIITAVAVIWTSAPKVPLLWICGEVQPAVPDDLDCGPPPEAFLAHGGIPPQ